MYLLDTNVVSELRKLRDPRTDATFVAWVDAATPDLFYLATVTLLELESGIVLLERRDPVQGAYLRFWFENFVPKQFAGRTLDFDTDAASATANLPTKRTLPTIDSMLAGIAKTRGLTVATHNVRDFKGTGVPGLTPGTVPRGGNSVTYTLTLN